jgi:hypothetical protein
MSEKASPPINKGKGRIGRDYQVINAPFAHEDYNANVPWIVFLSERCKEENPVVDFGTHNVAIVGDRLKTLAEAVKAVERGEAVAVNREKKR